MKQTKLKTRIQNRENFYLDMVVGSEIDLTLPNGSIMGMVKCLSEDCIATKMNCDNGWTMQNTTTRKVLKNMILGTSEANAFIKGDAEEKVAHPQTGTETPDSVKDATYEAMKKNTFTSTKVLKDVEAIGDSE